MNISQQTLTLIDNLQCTDKALAQLQSYTQDLAGRERQFLFLMMRNDELSLRALERFIEKIDVSSLIRRGFLTATEGGSTVGYEDPLEEIIEANDSAPVSNGIVLPSVALASGNVG